jgi:hypothetical protein
LIKVAIAFLRRFRLIGITSQKEKKFMNDTVLLFDRSAILGSDSHFWRGVSALGTCIIPQLVLEEINSIVSGFGTDGSNTQAAEFQRFMAASNWQISDVSATDPRLSQKLGSSASRNSRLDLAIAECAYGLALQTPAPIILVANTNSLSQAVNNLNRLNLLAVTLPTVKTWLQNRQIPEISILKNPSIKVTSRAVTVRNANYARLNKILAGLIGWIVIMGIGLVVWRSLQPKEFNKFWQKTGLPNLLK